MQRKRPLRYYLNLAAFALFCFILFSSTAYAGVMTIAHTRPAHASICCITPADWGFAYENVTIPTSDGLKLSGWYLPSRNKAAVILLHGYGANRLHMRNHAIMLASQGFGVLMYDLRGHGESQGEVASFGWRDIDDINGAIDYLLSRPEVDPQRIGIFGFSIGAQAALGAAVRYPVLKAVAADGPGFATTADIPPTNFLVELVRWPSDQLFMSMMEWRTGVFRPLSLTKTISTIAPRPLLLISAGTGVESQQVAYYYALAGQPKQLWNIPEAWHGGGVKLHAKEYAATLTGFFQESLNQSPVIMHPRQADEER
jgi:uncharacterized protein